MADLRLLAFTHLLAAGAGFAIAPREILDSDVHHVGFFTTDVTHTLAAAVESLRGTERLQVLSYKGSAAVSVERSFLWVFDGHQDLIVPATVSYFVDFSTLTLDDLTYDERAKVVTVKLPPLVMGDVSLQAEAGLSRTGGLLSLSPGQVDALSRTNLKNARRAFIRQASGVTLIKEAQDQAKADVARLFELPLRIAGRSDVKVVATFEGK